MTERQLSWLVVPRPNPHAEIRLFCFHYAGGNSLTFRNWHKQLLPVVEVCAVELPGRGRRLNEPHLRRMTDLISALTPTLLPYVDIPFVLFGHSMGAIIAFEVAQKLREDYQKLPAHLFASGSNAPQMDGARPKTYDLPEDEFIEKLRRLNGTPGEVLENPELMQLMLPLLRADFELIETYSYTPRPQLNCPITAVGGAQDNYVSRQGLEAWRAETTGEFNVRVLPGDHFFLHTHQALLLRILEKDIHTYLTKSV